MTFRTQVFLPDEWADVLQRLAAERGAPVGVLARMALIEWMRDQVGGELPSASTKRRGADSETLS